MKNKLMVQYDNGDKEEVDQSLVSELETLPVDFGDEEEALLVRTWERR